MRIAQVSHSLDCGGSMTLMAALSAELARHGHEVEVVCIDRRSGSAHEAYWLDWLAVSGVTVYFLGRKLGTAGVGAWAKLWWLIQRKRYDVVHSHLPMPDAMCGLVRRMSFSRFAHFITVHNTHEPRSWVLSTLGSGAHVVYCSEAVRRRNPLAGLSSTVIPNGISQLIYAPGLDSKETIRRRLGLPPFGKLVIGIGRMCPQKDFATTLDTMALLTQREQIGPIHCLLCGEGDAKQRLMQQARQRGLDGTVHFLGARTDIPELLRASDVFLSTSRYEGMPLTVLEALSAGIACVLSDIEEHRELAAAMPGCLFAARNAEAMANAVVTALEGPADPHLLLAQRSGSLKKYTLEACAESYGSLYQACSPARLSSDPNPSSDSYRKTCSRNL